MTPEVILAVEPRKLSQDQRRQFFDLGYVQVPGAIPADAIVELRSRMEALIEQSRSVRASDATFIIAPGHSAAAPRLRRIEPLAEDDPVFWHYVTEIEADFAADLVGPDVKYWATNINTKWSAGGDPVSWHQDIAFDPHTNFAYLQILVHLDDVTEEQGPLKVVPLSHKGPIFEHYNNQNRWTGAIDPRDYAAAGIANAISLPGEAGSLTALHCRTVHGSEPNFTNRMRPLLINAYRACDAFPYGYGPVSNKGGGKNAHSGELVRGREAAYAHHDPVRWRMPPDFSSGYTSIYEYQQQEERTPAPVRPGSDV